MPKKGRVGSGRGSQLKGNNVKAGTAAPSALTGKDTNRWNVTGEAKRMAEAQMDRTEPFVEAPISGYVSGDVGIGGESFPAIYGVDMKEKRRQQMLTAIAGSGKDGPLGDRQVMLDDKTIDWIIKEQDRIYMIERDMTFERSAKQQGLFNNPAGLEYLHKINPGYFARRRKMAKWLVKTQLKLFDIFFGGVQSEADFDFMNMIQSLPPDSLALIDKPAHKLGELDTSQMDGLYQVGALRTNLLPKTGPGAVSADNRVVPFAGATDENWRATAVSPLRGAGVGMSGTYGQNWNNVLGKTSNLTGRTAIPLAAGAPGPQRFALDSFLDRMLGR